MLRWLCLVAGAATAGIAAVLVISWITPHSDDCCGGHSAGTLASSGDTGRGHDAGQHGCCGGHAASFLAQSGEVSQGHDASQHCDSGATHATQPPETRGEWPNNLASLSKADRLLAEKQRVCPVTGNMLGSMGQPHPVTIKGKTVILCCPSCEERIRKEPDKYLAKLVPEIT